MLIYAIYLALLLILLYTCTNSFQKKAATIFFAIITLIIVGLRDVSVGTDTLSYTMDYIYDSNFSVDWNAFEPGNQFLKVLCANLSLSNNAYLFLMSILYCVPTFLLFYKFSSNSLFTILLFFTIGPFNFFLSGLRQSIAIGMLTLGIILFFSISQQRIIKYLLFILFCFIASTIHNSAHFCYILIILLFLSKFNTKSNILIILLPLLTFFVGDFLQTIVYQYGVVKYFNYFDDSTDINIIGYFVIPYCLLLFCIFLKSKSQKSDNRFLNFCFLNCIVYAIISGLSISLPMFNRFIYYFQLPTLIYVSDKLLQFEQINNKRLASVALIIICIIFFFVTNDSGSMGIGHYVFC